MLRKSVLFMALLAPFASLAATGYPTPDKVRMVVACMTELGAQNEENLLTCSCKQDVFERQLPFADYEQASLYERYVNMPGKRGNLFRDSDEGRDYVKKLRAARTKSEDACPLVRKITRETIRQD